MLVHRGFSPFAAGAFLHKNYKPRCRLRRYYAKAVGGDKPEPNGQESPPSGSPKDDAQQNMQLPQEVIQQLRDVVFGFDTFYVTSVENYQANGVLFKGNLRGRSAAESYTRTAARLKTVLGDAYRLYFLEDQQNKPVAVVLPKDATQELTPRLPEGVLAALFAAGTIVTTLNTYGLSLLDSGNLDLSPASISQALPGTLAFFALLGVHEGGHRWAAKRRGVELSLPFFIPAGLGLLGSFGSITRFKSTLPNRQTLLEVAAAGPAAGAAASLACLLLGLGLSAGGLGGVTVEPSAFEDSLLVGALGKLFLSGQLAAKQSLDLNPLTLAGWAGLVVNALNMIPLGELDGGRVAFAMWGRRAASRIGVVSTLLLGLSGVIDELALYWVLLVLFLQRGPLVPQQEELSEPSKSLTPLAVGLLFLPFLVLLPFPFGFSSSSPSVEALF
ncbi:hypothetical protein ABBQ32_010337 [Trebouxia sp. C0010 RCD-2024]